MKLQYASGICADAIPNDTVKAGQGTMRDFNTSNKGSILIFPITRQNIALSRARATDGVVGRTGIHIDPVPQILQASRSRWIQPNNVAIYNIMVGCIRVEIETRARIAGNDVSICGRCASHLIIVRSIFEFNSISIQDMHSQAERPRRVRAKEVPSQDVIMCPAAIDPKGAAGIECRNTSDDVSSRRDL